jgi:hypothetical protein
MRPWRARWDETRISAAACIVVEIIYIVHARVASALRLPVVHAFYIDHQSTSNNRLEQLKIALFACS